MTGGSLEFTGATVLGVAQTCETELRFDTTLLVTGAGGQLTLPAVLNDLCPGDCSGHGTCTRGEWLQTMYYQVGYITMFLMRSSILIWH